MTDKGNKERTSITIHPDLLARVREHCKEQSELSGRKVSFSETVSKALEAHVGPGPAAFTSIVE